jgi:carboxyl-terminal processing protease
MRRKNILPVFLLTGLLIMGLTLVLGGVNKKKAVEEEYGEALKLFNQALSLIHDNYVDPEKTEVKELIYGAVEGMVKKLDDLHSRFMDPEAYKEMEIEARGSFEGLGIVIGIKESQLTIISPLDDTPAYRAGIKAGDKIIEIEAKSTKEITLPEAVKKLRGPKGTKVTITVEREGEPEALHFTITRDTIKPRAVTFKVLEDNADLPGDKIGYVRIPSFNQYTNKELESILEKLSKKGIGGLIIDLRNNPGGLLNEAVKVSDKFISQGLIVSTKGRAGGQTREYKAQARGTYKFSPLVILINEGSASGSEIVAGAIKDNKRGILVGTKTFGKASVQSVIDLPGDCGISLTTAKYYTPSGRSIHEMGINPDIEVKYPRFSKEEGRIFGEDDLFREFAKEYLKSALPDEQEEFTLDKKALRDFEAMLKKKDLNFKPELLKRNREFLEKKTRLEIIRESKGEKEARLYALKQDLQVKRALEFLKAAKILRE